MSSSAGTERAGERRGRDRVVDVVEPGQARARSGAIPPASRASNAARSNPCREISRAATSSGGRCVVAARTAVVAEVADVRGGVVVRRATADAVLRVGSVLERWAGHARIVETEGDAFRMRLGHRGELRVVGVVDESRLCSQSGHRVPPALGDQLELAVAVELVAEEVAEADRSSAAGVARARGARPRPPRTARDRRRRRRAAPTRLRRRGSRPRRCARAGAVDGGSRPPSRSWSSSRSWRRPPLSRRRAARRDGRSRRGRARPGACPGSSSRRPRRGVARAPRRRGRLRSRARVGDGRASGERSPDTPARD